MKSEIKILIADDIADMRGVLKRELREFGYENVVEASNGEDALKKYHLNKFHMALIDVNMPIKNGVELLKDIRSIDSNVFVVMVSADSSAEIIKTTLALGVNGFVVKPYSAAKIGGIIQKFNKHLLGLASSPTQSPYG
jgi:two-component system chemotaxis response regulator CheY